MRLNFRLWRERDREDQRGWFDSVLFKLEEERLIHWCQRNGYTELQYCNMSWWAIPPGGYVPVPLDIERGGEL